MRFCELARGLAAPSGLPRAALPRAEQPLSACARHVSGILGIESQRPARVRPVPGARVRNGFLSARACILQALVPDVPVPAAGCVHV
jgi:hypothetical protein